MYRINPKETLRIFNDRDIQVDYHRILITTHQNAIERLVGERVNFLVRDIGRYVYKICLLYTSDAADE